VGVEGVNICNDGMWGGRMGKAVWRLLSLWSLCVFGYISVVVEEGICVKDCRGLGLCKVGTVGCSVGDKCKGGRGSLVTSWGRMGEEGEG
jgi:hypothetical protein